MATKKVGAYVKEARTGAKLTQEKLAQKAGEGLTASDIGKCERGEIDLTNAQLKKIAVACGVTQTSLVNAPKNVSAKTSSAARKPAAKTAAKTASAKKTDAGKTTSAKTTAAKKTDAKKTSSAKTSSAKTSSAKKTDAKKTEAKKTEAKKTAAKKPAAPANANTSMKVTSTEKKLVETYRGATSEQKKIALKVLKGEYNGTAMNVLGLVGGDASSADDIGDALGNLLGNLLTGGK